MTGDESHSGQLSGSFGAGSAAPSSFAEFAHPEQDKIIERCEEILNQIPKGKELVEARKRYEIPVTVITGQICNYTTPDDQSIVLMVFPDYDKDFEYVVITYATALRDAEQSFTGFKRPSANSDPAEYASMTFSKSLDIIMNMCIIADELKEKLGFTKPLDLIVHLGHGNLYKAYKADADYDELVNTFLQDD